MSPQADVHTATDDGETGSSSDLMPIDFGGIRIRTSRQRELGCVDMYEGCCFGSLTSSLARLGKYPKHSKHYINLQ